MCPSGMSLQPTGAGCYRGVGEGVVGWFGRAVWGWGLEAGPVGKGVRGKRVRGGGGGLRWGCEQEVVGQDGAEKGAKGVGWG